MAQQADILDLERLVPDPGDGRRVDVAVRPGKLTYADQTYAVPARTADARVDLSHASSGYAMRLRFATDVRGPCVRCLGAAEMRIEVDAREVHQPSAEEEELRSPYVEAGALDVAAWSHDALALSMPAQFVCRSDCAGLCPICGESLNVADPEEHRHERARDPRWAKLSEIRFD